MSPTVEFSIESRAVVIDGRRVRLNSRAYSFVLLLALRAAEAVERVTLDDVVHLRPWRHLSTMSAGKAIQRLSAVSWFDVLVFHDDRCLTTGPYRFAPSSASFVPSSAAAYDFLSSARERAPRSGERRGKQRVITELEVTAFEALVHAGIRLPAVDALLLERLGAPSKIRDPERRHRVHALLQLFFEERGRLRDAAVHAQAASKLVRRVRLREPAARSRDVRGKTRSSR